MLIFESCDQHAIRTPIQPPPYLISAQGMPNDANKQQK